MKYLIFTSKYLVFAVSEVIPPLAVSPSLHLPDLPDDLLHHLRPAHVGADLHLQRVRLPLLNSFHHVGEVLDKYLDQIPQTQTDLKQVETINLTRSMSI